MTRPVADARRSTRHAASGFHEWPLVVFTTLAIGGAGLLSAPLVAAVLTVLGATAVANAGAFASRILLGEPLLAAGLLVSLAHLGRPFASPRALARVGRSRLSAEIVLAGVALFLGALALFVAPSSRVIPIAAGACALAFLVALGLVYALPAQLTWRGSLVLAPAVLGLGVGTLALGAAGMPIATAGVFLVGVDFVLLLDRCARLLRASRTAGSRAGLPRASTLGLLFARVVLVDVLPAYLFAASLPQGAAGALGLGILVDRLAFYLLAVQHTTESEIARVEDVIARLPGDSVQ